MIYGVVHLKDAKFESITLFTKRKDAEAKEKEWCEEAKDRFAYFVVKIEDGAKFYTDYVVDY